MYSNMYTKKCGYGLQNKCEHKRKKMWTAKMWIR